jgi:serine/threonine protein kinase
VKLVDFGLAKANSQIESTDPGVVKGKFSYLSPEAASGLEVDARADVFAVGIILWELFTGKRLFYGDTDYQTVEQVRQARVPSLQALNPDIEPELEGVVRKALARDPEDRYHHAADLGDALAQYLFSRRMKVTARDIASWCATRRSR